MSENRLGSVIASKYRLDAELGRGGMGAVYRAYHLRVHKEFAIKLLLGEMLAHRSVASRFLLEAQAAGRIGHPGILDVYDVGEDADGTPFIVMELLRGEPLAALVRRGPVDLDAACWVAIGVLDALEAAHRAGVIHRDVKPQNVFLTEREVSAGGAASSSVVRGIKLLDFGIAKFGDLAGSALTRSGDIIGSPLYMAPEQARGESDLDARADVWSVGAMLFEMLTGKCAHAATTPVAVLAKVLTQPAPPPSAQCEGIPPEVDAVVLRALSIDRDLRFAAAAEMRDALIETRRKLGTADAPPALPRASPGPAAAPGSSADDTPGAISSTVSASASQPKRPSSSPVENDAVPSEARAAQSAPAAPARRGLAMPAALVGLVLLSAFLYLRRTDDRRDVAPAPASTTAAQSPSTAPASAVVPPIATSIAPSAVAPSASAVVVVARPPAVVTPKCAANEVSSRGHCCPRGLEWEGDHCERPLAKSF